MTLTSNLIGVSSTTVFRVSLSVIQVTSSPLCPPSSHTIRSKLFFANSLRWRFESPMSLNAVRMSQSTWLRTAQPLENPTRVTVALSVDANWLSLGSALHTKGIFLDPLPPPKKKQDGHSYYPLQFLIPSKYNDYYNISQYNYSIHKNGGVQKYILPGL